mgnify:CR=1 FL=1
MFSRFTQDHVILIFLLLVVFASAADLIADLGEGVNNTHLIQEGAILFIAISAFAWLARSLAKSNSALKALHIELEAMQNLPAPTSAAVIEIKQKLSEAISEQFLLWELTKSEKEIGQLLLKGYSLKEISALRGTSEKTIRQQASSIYQKANLPGRHAFSAWFIEDLL